MRHRSAVGRVAALAISALSAVVGCEGAPLEREDGSASAPRAAPSTSHRPGAPSRPSPTRDAASAASRPPTDAAPRVRLRTIAPLTDGKDGRFEATSVEGDSYRLQLATQLEPEVIRHPIAAYRLAHALGLRSVPRTVGQRVPLGELSKLLAPHPPLRSALEARLSVGNDGAVAALVQRRCDGRPKHITTPTFRRLAELAASSEPLPVGARAQVRGYVELVLLDYLTGNVERGIVAYDDATGRVCIADNRGAFPGTVRVAAHDLLLQRLRPIRRYPRGFQAALAALTPEATKRLLQPGSFGSWLVGPRELSEFAERRATLLTLLHALSGRYGREDVFCL